MSAFCYGPLSRDSRTYPEPAVTGQPREGAIVEIRSLQFLGLSAQRILEREPGPDCFCRQRCFAAAGRGTLTLAEERARGNNGETNPQSVNHTAQESNDFMPKKRRERNEDQNGDRDEPTSWNVPDFLGEWSQFLRSRPVKRSSSRVPEPLQLTSTTSSWCRLMKMVATIMPIPSRWNAAHFYQRMHLPQQHGGVFRSYGCISASGRSFSSSTVGTRSPALLPSSRRFFCWPSPRRA